MAARAASGRGGSNLGGLDVKVGFGVWVGSGFERGRRGFGGGRGSPREDGAGGHHASTGFAPERAESAARAGFVVGRAGVRVRLGSRVGGVGINRGGRGTRDALRGARAGGGGGDRATATRATRHALALALGLGLGLGRLALGRARARRTAVPVPVSVPRARRRGGHGSPARTRVPRRGAVALRDALATSGVASRRARARHRPSLDTPASARSPRERNDARKRNTPAVVAVWGPPPPARPASFREYGPKRVHVGFSHKDTISRLRMRFQSGRCAPGSFQGSLRTKISHVALTVRHGGTEKRRN